MPKPLKRLERMPRSGPTFWVVRLKKNQRGVFTILSRTWWMCQTHWNGRATEACFENKKECPGCKRGYPGRAKAYLHAWDHGRKAEVFLECTPGLVDQMDDDISRGENYRGQRIELERGSGDKARLRVKFLAHHTAVSDQELPAERDPEPVLRKLWGADDVQPRQADEPTLPLPTAM